MEALFLQLGELLEKSPPRTLQPPSEPLRESAVLVPLFIRGERLHVVLTKRPETLRTHAGQISFPGGSREASDSSFLETALRETEEELGLSADRVEVLGALDEVQTSTGFRIFPFVGAIPGDFRYQTNSLEVEGVIEAPVRELLQPGLLRVERRPPWSEVYFYDYGEHLIWGATARILRNLLQVLVKLPGV